MSATSTASARNRTAYVQDRTLSTMLTTRGMPISKNASLGLRLHLLLCNASALPVVVTMPSEQLFCSTTSPCKISNKNANHKMQTSSNRVEMRRQRAVNRRSRRRGCSVLTAEILLHVSTWLGLRRVLRNAPHMTLHLLLSLAFVGLTANATRAASVNASLTPLFLIAEHSAVY